MKARRPFVPTVLAAAGLIASFGLPGSTSTVTAAAPRGPVAVQSVQLFDGKSFHFNPCNPAGTPQAVFPNTVKRIYAYASFSTWQGRHRVRFKWYLPSGKLFDPGKPATFSDNGPTVTCDYLSVSGYQAADHPGRWTMHLFVDRRVVMITPFTLTAVRGPVRVGSIHFYSGKHFHFNPCNPAGKPSTVFPNTVARIYAYVRYRTWQGTHRDRYRWYAPGGRLFTDDKTSPYTSHGPTQACDYISVARTRAARLLGRWRFQLLVDKRPRKVATFTLVRRG